MAENFDFIDSKEFKSFLSENAGTDPSKLRLKEFRHLDFDKNLAITQIECRAKARKKIPELAEQLAYPTDVSIEQCSSETLARFHASLFKKCDSAVDLTCGLGIDTYYISQEVDMMTSIDASETVASAAKRNMAALGRTNVEIINSTAEEYVDATSGKDVSAFFVDPSRRLTADRTQRTYAIRETIPDLNFIIPRIEKRCDFIVVKASPMVDLTQTLNDFKRITDVWVLSVRNECKEVLFKIDFNSLADETTKIHCTDFTLHGTVEFTIEQRAEIADGQPAVGDCLLIPNASIMKAGAYDALGAQLGLTRIAANSHLHLAANAVEGYPGRQFKIKEVLSLSKADIKKLKGITVKANIACRNFPMKPEELKKKLKIEDGGNYYIFATTLADKSRCLLLCEPVNA